MSCCTTRFDSNHVALNSANGLSITFSTIATVTLIAISIIVLAPALPVVSTLAAIGFGLKTFALMGAASSFFAIVAQAVAAVYSGKVIASEKFERAQRPNLQALQQTFQTATAVLQTAAQATNDANTALIAGSNLFKGSVQTINQALGGFQSTLQKAEVSIAKSGTERSDLIRDIRTVIAFSKEVPKEKVEKEHSATSSPSTPIPLHTTATFPKTSVHSAHVSTSGTVTTPPKDHTPHTVTVAKSPLKDLPANPVSTAPVPVAVPDTITTRPRSKSGIVSELTETHTHEIEKAGGHALDPVQKKEEKKN